MKVPRGCCC